MTAREKIEAEALRLSEHLGHPSYWGGFVAGLGFALEALASPKPAKPKRKVKR